MNHTYIVITDPRGRNRKIRSIPNYSGFGAEAYIRVGLFKREQQFAASREGAVMNLINRLEKSGWSIEKSRETTMKRRPRKSELEKCTEREKQANETSPRILEK